MTEPSLIQELPYESADAFIGDLSPVATLWSSTGGVWDENEAGGRRNWVFRGQRLLRPDWDLSPSAMRAKALTYYAIGKKVHESPTTVEEQIRAECDEVFRFVRRCIRAGLPLPEDSQWLRSGNLTTKVFPTINEELGRGVDFPFALDRSLFALAQHYGVPTRLLDWTESPLVAAYFACRNAAEGEKKRRALDLERTLAAKEAGAPMPESTPSKDRLVVCALRQSAFVELEQTWRARKLEPTLDVVEAPFEDNPNLRAQRGLFTLIRYRTPRDPVDFRLPSIEEVISAYERSDPAAQNRDLWLRMKNGPWLRKLTLPHVEAPKLLRLLDQFNVNAGTIYPGYNGVVQSIQEREFFG